MPMDAKGKYHMNPHHAKMADSMPEKKEQGKAPVKKPTEAEPEIGDQGEHQSTTLHDHGDGTFHTESADGDMQEHPSIHHALSHMAEKHGHEPLAAHIMAHHGMEDGEEEAEAPPMQMHAGMMGGY